MRLSAADAERWGLIWACVDDEALIEQATAIAQRLAAGPTQAFRRIKKTFNREPAGTLQQQLALEAALQAQLADTAGFRRRRARVSHQERAPFHRQVTRGEQLHRPLRAR